MQRFAYFFVKKQQQPDIIKEFKKHELINEIKNSSKQQAFRKSLVSGTRNEIFTCQSINCSNEYVPEQDPESKEKPQPEAVIAVDPIMCIYCSAIYCKGCETGEHPDRIKRRERIQNQRAEGKDLLGNDYDWVECRVCGMRDSSKLVALDPYRMAIYERLVVKCPYPRCSGRFMMKNRNQHYEKYCNHFNYFECHANICRIKLNKNCECEICKYHDCYSLTEINIDSEFESKS